MKLLLDEMYPPSIAEGLRAAGVDAVAVQELPELRGLADGDLFIAAQLAGRCLITENVVDFVPIEARWRAEQASAHAGLVLVSPASFPRPHHTTIGRMVRAVAALVSAGRPEPGTIAWLAAADAD